MQGDLLYRLNKEQKEAVLTNDVPLLILAGAGSGKTRVLTTKIAYLIKEALVSEYNILAFTFTNKAAKEMKERVGQLLDKNISHMWIGTFHSICSRILRRDIDALGYSRNFTIYDTADQKTLLKEVFKELNIDDKLYKPSSVLGKISDYKNRFVTPQEVIDKSPYPREQMVGEAYRLYEQKKSNNNALDFDDLILFTIKLLKENDDIRAFYSKLFRYVFVDEYQDTNKAQYELIRLFTELHDRICVVGDSDQSIYSWRGADISNILDFEKDYKDAKVILLEQNYRSTQNILDAANKLIKNNEERKDKNLWTDNKKGADIIYKTLNDGKEEAATVLNWIFQMKGAGYSYKEMAILYRTNAQSRLFEEKLMYEGIPHRVVGGLKFYDRKEVKDIIAYLNVLDNTDDDLSFKRIINVPKRGIGNKTLEKLEDFAFNRGLSMYDATYETDLENEISKASLKKLRDACDLLTDLINLSEALSVTDFVTEVYERSGYDKMLKASKTIEDKTRIENIESLINAIAEYEKDDPDATLSDYLQSVSLLSDVDKTLEEEGVSLMTIHAAKGLEYDVIFLTGMEEGLFPSKRTLEEDGLEEERRLCYVAITRAKERLYISSSRSRMTYGQITPAIRSRFIDEIYSLLKDETKDVKADLDYNFSDYTYLKEIRREIKEEVKQKIKERNEAQSWDYRVGDKVRHKKFGEGMIVQIKDMDEGKELMISFDKKGLKRLSSLVAPLEKI